jgi:plastocyanin
MFRSGTIAVLAAAVVVPAVCPRPLRADEERGIVRGAVSVTRPKGLAADRVVVYLVGFKEPAPTRTVKIVQRGKRFIPSVVAITVGQAVGFPNGDPFLHNVFSPTPLRPFDLGSFPEGETRERPFSQPGVVDVFCNIHPEMSATILVLPNRRFAVLEREGRFEIRGVPSGTWTVYAYSRRARRPAEAKVVVTAGGTAEVALSLEERAVQPAHRNKFGEKYREPVDFYR